MSNQCYSIPKETTTFEEEIKRSRFITYLIHTRDIKAAKKCIADIKVQHPNARHHCWAHVAGAPNDSQVLGFSDDGEPAGTAGKPILAQLMGSQFGEITAVVVRYYGGILLGTGGLVKAYGNGVKQALTRLPVIEKIPRLQYDIICDYHLHQEIVHLIEQQQGIIEKTDYTTQIKLQVNLPIYNIEMVKKKLQDMSRGKIELIKSASN